MAATIFTVGHSNHSIDFFLELLQSQNINCIIDVRSTPASRYNPQYNQTPLKNFLKNNQIQYLHFGEEFGARHEDEKLLDEDGIVQFEWFQKTKIFQQGVERVDLGTSKGYRIALMCSEGNPLECHRFSMISVYFQQLGFEVLHILKDKTIASHSCLEKELLKKFEKKLPVASLFEPDVSETDKIKAAYRLHNKEIGWQPSKEIAEIEDI